MHRVPESAQRDGKVIRYTLASDVPHGLLHQVVPVAQQRQAP